MPALNFVDRYSSTLSSGYTAGATSISVSSAATLPSGACNFYVIVKAEGVNTEEVFQVTNVSGTTLTVVGAQANTSSSNHGAGAVIIGTIMTVNAFTQYTNDVNAAAPRGMVQLGQVVTAASATSVHFASIPGGYSNLVIVYTCRSQAAVSTDALYMEVNSDTTSGDYTATQYVLANGASVSGGTVAAGATAGAWITNVPGTSASANYPSAGVIRIPVYSGTTFYKKFVHNGDYAQSGVTNITIQTSGVFKSTAAITDLIFSMTSSDAFVNGSTFTLYGEL